MFFLIRAAAYALSGIMLWHVVQDGVPAVGFFAPGAHLVLDTEHSMVFGVCAGVSNYTGIDVSVIRIAWALAALYRGIGLGLYVLAFLIMPLHS